MRAQDFAQFDERVRLALAVSVSLLQQIVAAFPRLSSASQRGSATDIGRFVETRSWTDFALGLVRLELPTWRVRRLTCEENEWFCSLSQQPNLPLALDQTADGTHDDLPLAILRALIEALRINADQRRMPAHLPLIVPVSGVPICCDNFV
jgi:hypothetical protein